MIFKLNKYDHTKGTVECDSCGGVGKRYYFEDRDSYEGYKLANKKVCDECHGSGRVFSHGLIDNHKQLVAKYNQQVEEFNKYAIIATRFRNMLTKRERAMMRLLKTIPRLKKMV